MSHWRVTRYVLFMQGMHSTEQDYLKMMLNTCISDSVPDIDRSKNRINDSKGTIKWLLLPNFTVLF